MSSNTRSMSAGVRQIRHAGATGGDQQEHAPHGGFQLEHQSFEILVFVHVAAGQGGVDLQIQADVMGAAHGFDGAVEGAGHAAERIVGFAGGAIEAQATCVARRRP